MSEAARRVPSRRFVPGRALLRLCLAVALLAFTAALQPAAAQRIALLIGNGTYADAALNLRNPSRDAEAFGAALRDLGFEVTVLTDAGRERMIEALAAFSARLAGAEIGLFYFAGHGLQLNGVNYLLSSSVSAPQYQDIIDGSLDVFQVRDAFARNRPRLSVIVLDACRNNPFREDLAEVAASAPGLARESGDAGMLIAYATDPGNVASDGSGDNSQFMEGLLANVETPGLEVRLMFGRVRQYVITHTAGRQVPWVEESVVGEYFLKPGPAPSSESFAEAQHWQAIAASLNPADYQRHLEQFPDGVFAPVARERLARLESGEAIQLAGAGVVDDVSVDSLSAEDRRRLQLALKVLGYYTGAVSGAADEATGRALGAYLGMSGSSSTALDQVVSEASRNLVLIGASVGMQISNDLVRLRSIDRALDDVALPALAELERRLAERNGADDAEILATARAQIAQMQALRDRVEARLDYTRSYYAELIDTAAEGFPQQIASLSGEGASRTVTTQPALAQLTSYADRFIQHALAAEDPDNRGSYRWLADYLQQ